MKLTRILLVAAALSTTAALGFAQTPETAKPAAAATATGKHASKHVAAKGKHARTHHARHKAQAGKATATAAQ